MWNNLFKHIDIDPENAHILDGNAPDLVKECQAFEKKIADAGGIELFLGGKYYVNNETMMNNNWLLTFCLLFVEFLIRKILYNLQNNLELCLGQIT